MGHALVRGLGSASASPPNYLSPDYWAVSEDRTTPSWTGAAWRIGPDSEGFISAVLVSTGFWGAGFAPSEARLTVMSGYDFTLQITVSSQMQGQVASVNVDLAPGVASEITIPLNLAGGDTIFLNFVAENQTPDTFFDLTAISFI